MSIGADELSILEYIYDQSGGDLGQGVHLWPHFDQHDFGPAVRRLHKAGLINMHSIAGDYSISHFGIRQVSELRAKRRNGPARTAALRQALVLWLYDSYTGAEAPPATTEEFGASDRSLFCGQSFSDRETELAVSYLHSVGLIQGLQVDQSSHLLAPSLTVKGVDCAESEKSVSEFLNPPASSGPTFNVRVDGSQNVVVGTQSDFTQNNNSGIDPAVLAQLTHFATVARQGIPSYGLPEEQQVEVERISNELEAEASGNAPERGRLRQLSDRLMAALAPAAGNALGGMVMALGEQAAHAIAGS
ncbi:hypothetical protein [Streptomyces incarnatus]|uniref:hypothetical protein n=1 Tax=Streptomyces incarnatus TaxID=665007 RepID=UPI001AD83CA2|nr:hypothetical protein [Streptomyces incarnatus]